MPTVLVFIDHPGQALHKGQLELLTLARSIGDPVAAFNGDLTDAVRTMRGDYGVGAIYRPSTDLDGALVAPKAAFVAAAAREADPAAVLLPNTFEGKEIAARTGIKLGFRRHHRRDRRLRGPDRDQERAGRLLHGAGTGRQGTPIVTVKANVVAEVPRPKRPCRSWRRSTPGTSAPPPASPHRAEKAASGRPALTEARVVVAGGRGTGGDFSPIEDLADALGGAVGASRAATDAGWIEHSAQVGQTGKTVSPQLYVSAGISGAIQQKAGMQTAKVIVAVNNDADSPVFEIADFGVVGDLAEVLPQAAAEIRRRKG